MTTEDESPITPEEPTPAPEAEGRPVEGTPPPEPRAASTAEEKVALLENERKEMRERMLRIAAEFENYKKRVRREQSENESRSREAVLKDMLEVIDNLERAMAAIGESADVKGLQQGVQLVLRQFQAKLERYDVRPLEAKGQAFDPRVHDAISRVPTADSAPGTIISELQRGYRIGDRLLRPAAVVVAVALVAPEPVAQGDDEAAKEIDLDGPVTEGEEGGGDGGGTS